MARACGSYPQCPRFKSRCRYQNPKDGAAVFWDFPFSGSTPLGQPGPLVKWLRHRPFTAVTRVRVPYGSPIWRRSSAGRALASHARGHRFEFCRLHQKITTPFGVVIFLLRRGMIRFPCAVALSGRPGESGRAGGSGFHLHREPQAGREIPSRPAALSRCHSAGAVSAAGSAAASRGRASSSALLWSTQAA